MNTDKFLRPLIIDHRLQSTNGRKQGYGTTSTAKQPGEIEERFHGPGKAEMDETTDHGPQTTDYWPQKARPGDHGTRDRLKGGKNTAQGKALGIGLAYYHKP
jgi:hypothetical protein